MICAEYPWPVPQVFPNFRNSHHWSKSAKHVKTQRFLAKVLTRAEMGGTEYFHTADRIPLEINFYPPNRIARDEDGCIGAAKSIQDGIADALRVNDKRFKVVYWFHEPAAPGRIVARIG